MGRLQLSEDWAAPDITAHWMLHFAVDPQSGTDAAVNRVLELGGRVDIDPYDTELGRIARVADPSGAVFALIDPTTRLEPGTASREQRDKESRSVDMPRDERKAAAARIVYDSSTLPITIYLSNEWVHEQVEAAVEDLLAAAGGHIEHRDDPVLGSWFRRIWARTGHAVHSPLARVTSAQQLQLDHQPQLAQSPHDILTALELRPGVSTQSADVADGTCGSTTPSSPNGSSASLRIASNNSEDSTPLNSSTILRLQ